METSGIRPRASYLGLSNHIKIRSVKNLFLLVTAGPGKSVCWIREDFLSIKTKKNINEPKVKKERKCL